MDMKKMRIITTINILMKTLKKITITKNMKKNIHMNITIMNTNLKKIIIKKRIINIKRNI